METVVLGLEMRENIARLAHCISTAPSPSLDVFILLSQVRSRGWRKTNVGHWCYRLNNGHLKISSCNSYTFVNYLEKNIFVDVIKNFEMRRLVWIIWVGPHWSHKYYRRQQAHRAECNAKMEARTVAMSPRMLRQPPEPGKGKGRLSPRISKKDESHIGFWIPILQNCDRIKFCCFKPPNLW